MEKLKEFKNFVNENVNEKTKDSVLSYWDSRWNGTCLEGFPTKFSEYFLTSNDFEKWKYDVNNNENEESDPDIDNMKYNIQETFKINIVSGYPNKMPYMKEGACCISINDWTKFLNDMWSWE